MPKTLRQWANLAPPTTLSAGKTILLLIDIQMDYYNPEKLPIPDGEAIAACAGSLMKWADEKGIPVVHIQQVSPNPNGPIMACGSPGAEFHPAVTPAANHKVIVKRLPSSFCGTELHEWLQARGIEMLIIGGLMTHMCVDSTTREAVHLGYKTIIVSDATASRDLPAFDGNGIVSHQEVRRAALSALADRFADVMTSKTLTELTVTD